MSQKKRQKTAALRPMRVDGMTGFPLSVIRKVLSPKQYARFQAWNMGQTVGVYENEPFIYKLDFERFKAGLLPFD